ncbi:glycosyltransferase family 25 protein [Thioclava sp. UBA3469]|uniref:glycosyltransferase family 25 protein n=1 Tax=Thioclava sp. UBA3469 TaxID=1947693 RepID=UPI000C402A0E|nr:glycosyltransferase family 25 protein [Thioclava sp. UBA3469]MAQ36091.1 hypothetical protein [Thioclava sp.]|tara:strand:+ start:911 stop:1663 length:753 start_codon:yes stop_codon:yes gene_type:complete
MKTYILTIEPPNGSRILNALRECERLDLSPEPVQGVTLQDADLKAAYSPLANVLRMKRSLTPGEIACYLGHRRIWAKMLDDGEEFALVCEDDFKVLDDDGFRSALAAARNREDWAVLKFFDFRPKPIWNSIPLGRLSMVDYKYPAAGAVCYLVRASGAEAMLRRKKIFRPVDVDFQYCWEFGITVRSVHPNPVGEMAENLGGSLLETARKSERPRRNPLSEIWKTVVSGEREIRSAAYRARVKKMQRNNS